MKTIRNPVQSEINVKKSQFIYYSREALAEAKDQIVHFAMREQLNGHANSVAIRFGETV